MAYCPAVPDERAGHGAGHGAGRGPGVGLGEGPGTGPGVGRADPTPRGGGSGEVPALLLSLLIGKRCHNLPAWPPAFVRRRVLRVWCESGVAPAGAEASGERRVNVVVVIRSGHEDESHTTHLLRKGNHMRGSTLFGRQETKRIAAALAVAGTLLVGGVVTAQNASANTTAGKQCRLGGPASETYGISDDPCATGDGSRGVEDSATFTNPGNVSIKVCAQLLAVNSNGSTTQVGDYGCNAAYSTARTITLKTTLHTDIGIPEPGGTFVVQAGYWENGGTTYVTGAQSGRVQVYG